MRKIIQRAILIGALGTASAGLFPPLHAQESEPSGGVSVALYGTICRGLSSSMRGSVTDFRRDVGTDYTNSSYPFGGNDWLLAHGGGEVAYGFGESPLGIYLGAGWTNFNVSDQGDRVHMGILTGSLGAEYAIGRRHERWNWFGRGGINTSLISGFVDYTNFFFGTFHTTLTPATRFGVEGELGTRYNFASSRISLEAAIHYMNANLVGKSYTPPAAAPPQTLRERELNDGADPNNPSDHDRTIDVVGLRLGARYSF